VTAPKRKSVRYSGDEPVRPPAGASVNGADVDSVGRVESGDVVEVSAEVADDLSGRDGWKAAGKSKATKTSARAKQSAAPAPSDGMMAKPDENVPEEG
jgi:hypothetical protein